MGQTENGKPAAETSSQSPAVCGWFGFGFDEPEPGCKSTPTHRVTYLRLEDGHTETHEHCALHALVVNHLWIVVRCESRGAQAEAAS